jgi:hypothetical protein
MLHNCLISKQVEQSHILINLTEFEREISNRIVSSVRSVAAAGNASFSSATVKVSIESSQFQPHNAIEFLQVCHSRIMSVLSSMMSVTISWKHHASIDTISADRLTTMVIRTIIQRLEEERSKLVSFERSSGNDRPLASTSPSAPLRRTPSRDSKFSAFMFSLTALSSYDNCVFSWLYLLHALRKYACTRHCLAQLHAVSSKTLYSLVKIGPFRVRRLALRTLKDVLCESNQDVVVASSPTITPSSPSKQITYDVSGHVLMMPDLDLSPSAISIGPTALSVTDTESSTSQNFTDLSPAQILWAKLQDDPMTMTDSPRGSPRKRLASSWYVIFFLFEICLLAHIANFSTNFVQVYLCFSGLCGDDDSISFFHAIFSIFSVNWRFFPFRQPVGCDPPFQCPYFFATIF